MLECRVDEFQGVTMKKETLRDVDEKHPPSDNPRVKAAAKKGWVEGTKDRESKPGQKLTPEELKSGTY